MTNKHMLRMPKAGRKSPSAISSLKAKVSSQWDAKSITLNYLAAIKHIYAFHATEDVCPWSLGFQN